MPGPIALPDLTPRTIASAYAFFGLIWIATSDVVLLALVSSQQTITAVQTVKGGVFVAISGVLIWGLTSRREAQISDSHERLADANQRLEVLQRIFRHNIRNDLNVVKGFVDLAREETETQRVKDVLRRASDTTADVLEISDKFRVLENYGAREEVRETVDLRSVIDSAVRGFRETYPEVDVTVDGPETVRVRGDGSIEYVLIELLENAAEHYTGSLDSLEVSVAIRERDDSVVLTVADNGPGIPDGEYDALLEGTESDLIHLSSVGLWLVYWLTDRVGADIDIETLESGGTEITVRFERAGMGPGLPASAPVGA